MKGMLNCAIRNQTIVRTNEWNEMKRMWAKRSQNPPHHTIATAKSNECEHDGQINTPFVLFITEHVYTMRMVNGCHSVYRK